MEVTTQLESLNHLDAISHMREHSQLELSIVSHNQLASLFRNEGLSNLVTVLVQGWLVLEVWLPAREAPRFSVQIHATVNAPLRVWGTLKRNDIGDQ